MDTIIIYHNGECSKSRGALEILQEQTIPHTVRWYIADPLGKQELTTLLKKLDIQPSELVRKSESLYTEQYIDREISEMEWLDILVNNPVLIERPIIEKGQKAIVARPPEKIFELV